MKNMALLIFMLVLAIFIVKDVNAGSPTQDKVVYNSFLPFISEPETCKIVRSYPWAVYFNSTVSKFWLSDINIDNSESRGFVPPEYYNLSFRITASDHGIFEPSYSGVIVNNSLVEGVFVFDTSQIKGFLVGSAKRNSVGNIIIKGSMVGGSYNSDNIQQTSIFKIFVSQDLKNCSIDIESIEHTIEQTNYEQRILTLENSQTTQEQKISALESWKLTINSWKDTITTSISNILSSITRHETRIDILENKTYSINITNITTTPYLKYLSSSDRKRMVCGYAQDSKLTHLRDLGFDCNVTYKTYPNGRITSSCKCKEE